MDDLYKLDQAILSAATGRPALPNGTHFERWISDLHSGGILGVILVDRPIPDPDTLFGELVNSSSLAGIPEGLRLKVDPEYMIPSPTKDCNKSACIAIIPVSTIDPV